MHRCWYILPIDNQDDQSVSNHEWSIHFSNDRYAVQGAGKGFRGDLAPSLCSLCGASHSHSLFKIPEPPPMPEDLKAYNHPLWIVLKNKTQFTINPDGDPYFYSGCWHGQSRDVSAYNVTAFGARNKSGSGSGATGGARFIMDLDEKTSFIFVIVSLLGWLITSPCLVQYLIHILNRDLLIQFQVPTRPTWRSLRTQKMTAMGKRRKTATISSLRTSIEEPQRMVPRCPSNSTWLLWQARPWQSPLLKMSLNPNKNSVGGGILDQR